MVGYGFQEERASGHTSKRGTDIADTEIEQWQSASKQDPTQRFNENVILRSK